MLSTRRTPLSLTEFKTESLGGCILDANLPVAGHMRIVVKG
jgi:hypothetical protein